jgi:ATP-dependent Clp protease ATP-binding subunit ClpA
MMSPDNQLQTLGRDLTDLAKRGCLDPVVGREREIEQALRVLCRRSKSNPLLLGEPGVGKTALAEGLAMVLAAEDAPPSLVGRRIFELQLGSLLAGTQFRGDLEQRLKSLLDVVTRNRTILFIDEIHLLVQAGRGGGMDAGNLLKPVLSRGDVSCIGATTAAEAKEMFNLDPAMERRFQPVLIEEPSPELVKQMLFAMRHKLEDHHHLRIADEAVEAAVDQSLQNVSSGRSNPDRALDILENACAAEQIRLARMRKAESLAQTNPELQKW